MSPAEVVVSAVVMLIASIFVWLLVSLVIVAALEASELLRAWRLSRIACIERELAAKHAVLRRKVDELAQQLASERATASRSMNRVAGFTAEQTDAHK